jgi:hypothetical protein
MLRSITILLLCSVHIGAADEKAQREEFRMSATVQDIVALSKYSVTPSLTTFPRGAAVSFAIHSPSRLFGAADAKGKSYDFVLHRETTGEKTRFSSLEVRR